MSRTDSQRRSGSDCTPEPDLQARIEALQAENTALRRDLAEARQHNADLQAFVRHLPFPATIRAADDTILVASDAAYSYFDRQPDAMVGRQAKEIRQGAFEVAISQKHQALMEQVVTTGQLVNTVNDYPHPDGIRVLRLILFPMDPPGSPAPRVGSLLLDETQQRKQEVQLARTAARGDYKDALLNAFIFDSPALLVLKDTHGRYIGVSHEVCRRFNRSLTEYIGKTDVDVFHDKERGAERHQQDLGIVASGETIVEEETFPMVPGMTILTSRFPLRGADGRILGVGALGMDVSEFKQTQRLVQEQSRQLEEFTYAAAHDLREPLRTVTAYLSMLLDEHNNMQDQRRYIQAAFDSANRMAGLINGLLQLASINPTGNPEGNADLDRVLANVVADHRQILDDHGVVVRLPAASIGAVPGDQSQLGQLFANLLSNAVKYRSPDRSPTVTIEAEIQPAAIVLRVADNGLGVPAEYRERVFNVFERLHPRSRYPGHGIGLTACRAIAARHGGSIALADGADSIGTTVVVRLPRGPLPSTATA